MAHGYDNRMHKIGDLSEASGLSVRTLRGYEELGIISPSRSEGGTRYYGETELAIARLAMKMRELNISVEMIKMIATRRREYETGDQSSAAMMELLEHLTDDLRDQAAGILAMQDEIRRTVRLLKGCQGCKNKPTPRTCPECPMQTNPDRTDMAQMIWQPT
ncbi:MerR family transcriptional regulator [Sedimentitalea sp.]|uniref:MerR family transcriptional regulator n=1 Tax=Sedimentitalea sp. TaxID=2048915 RepID=UPI00329745D3